MEKLWAFGSNLSTVMGAYLFVALSYLGITWIRIKKFNHKPGPPIAILYLPFALLGMAFGLFVFEDLLYSPSFWMTRNAHSFDYETHQGLMIFIALFSYPISLSFAHRMATRHFGAEAFSLKSKKVAKHAALQALLTLFAGFAFLSTLFTGVISFYCIPAIGKWGHFGGGVQRGVAQADRPFPVIIIAFMISLGIFIGFVYLKRRLAR